MREKMEKLNFIDARGPEGLRNVLDSLLQKSDKQHYINYKNGNQQAWIKADFSKEQPYFWYCDLQGRPLTKGVQFAIADFLWEKCGFREKYLASAEPDFLPKEQTPRISKSPFSLFATWLGKGKSKAPAPSAEEKFTKKG